MSYSILRVERVKGSGNTKGLQKHNQRENNNYNNKDIRHEDTHKNYDLIHEKNIDYNKLIADKIDANYTGNRKIRADAIRHVEGIITSDEKFFTGLSEEETHQFFKDSLDFAKKEYGEENLLYATVHLDEKVPHMHFGFVPLTDDGRLSAKDRLGNKKALTELQDRFNQHVNQKGYKLGRGTAKQVSEREHKDIDKFKKDTEFYKQELQKVQQDLQKFNMQLNVDIERMRGKSDFEYENEVEVTKGFFISREERETGRKIISAEEFEGIQQTVSSARRIVEDYERIKDTDYYAKSEELEEKLYQQYRKTNLFEIENNKLKKENKKLENELKLSKEFQKTAVKLYSVAKGVFPNFENTYNYMKEKAANMPGMNRTADFMQLVQDNSYEMESEREKPIKRRTNDLEL